MVMKIVLLAAVVMVLGHDVMGQLCLSRKHRNHYSQLLKKPCGDLQKIPVQLPVPEGFDSVKPSVAMLSQCTGLPCDNFHNRCLPTQTKTHTYGVEARKGEKTECTKVTVQEHLACECRCEEHSCEGDKVFNIDTCKCECGAHLEEWCNNRRYVHGEEVMWSKNMCSCKCDNEKPCPDQQKWNSRNCECASIN